MLSFRAHDERNLDPVSAVQERADTVTRKKEPKQRAQSVVMSTAAAGASWMALVAATTLGVGVLQRVRAEVSAQIHVADEGIDDYRLIVQSYSRGSLGQGGLPGAHVRPLASAQRAITLEELANGVSVDVVGLGEAVSEDEPVLIAWVERGKPDLEYDALRARPTSGAFYGVADTHAAEPRAAAQVVLSQRKG